MTTETTAPEFATWINTLELPTGRRLFVLSSAATIAHLIKEKAERESFVGVIDVLREPNRVAFEKEQHWQRQKNRQSAGPPALEADNFFDSSLGGFSQTATQSMKLNRNNPARLEETQQMLFDVFPNGITGVTSENVPTEIMLGKDIVAKLRGPWAKTVKALGLEPWVDLIDEATKQLEQRHTPSQGANQTINYTDVAAAQARGQETMRVFVVEVLSRWRTHSAADVAMRNRFLGPLFEQQEQVRAEYRRSRTPTDVDPTSGAPISPGTSDA